MNLGTSRVGDVDYCRIDYFLRLGVEWTWSVACSPLKNIDILIVAKSAANGACSASRSEEVGDHDLKRLELERR